MSHCAYEQSRYCYWRDQVTPNLESLIREYRDLWIRVHESPGATSEEIVELGYRRGRLFAAIDTATTSPSAKSWADLNVPENPR